MNDANDELLSRYIDGELSEQETATLLTRLEREPGLASRLENLSGVDRLLRDGFTNIDTDPPAHVVELLQQDKGEVVPFPGRPRSPWLSAAAACLLLGVGFLGGQQRGGAPAPAGPLPAESALSAALESRPSSAGAWAAIDQRVEMRPVLSFVDKSGAYCREFALAADGNGWHGVACRGESQWHTKVLVRQDNPTEKPGEFRPAAARDTDIIGRFIDRHIDGIPLGAEEESEQIQANWHRAASTDNTP